MSDEPEPFPGDTRVTLAQSMIIGPAISAFRDGLITEEELVDVGQSNGLDEAEARALAAILSDPYVPDNPEEL